MKNTKIEWCDSTWNPVTGCFHGCAYCYAERMAKRFEGYEPQYGASLTQTADEKGRKIYELGAEERKFKRDQNGKKIAAPYPFGFAPTLHRYRLDQPKKWKEPQTVFVCSMADLFGDWVPEEWITAVFAAADEAPQHRYIFLTKNPRRYGQLAREKKLPKRENFWYGSTLDSMKSLRYPGRFRDNTFVSIEPLTERMDVGLGSFGSDSWIIIGAETGNRKDKVTPKKEWVDTICAAADITHAAVFMKDSLIPIMGEENMRREFPWDTGMAKDAAGNADPGAAQDVLRPAT